MDTKENLTVNYPQAPTKAKLRSIICSQLTKFMKGHSLTQNDICRKSGLSKSTISKAVHSPAGSHAPLSVSSAYKLAEAYKLSFDYIYGRTDTETIGEEIANAIIKHIVPTIYPILSKGQTYSIPTLELSSCLASYFKEVWAVGSSALSADTQTAAKERAKNTLIEALTGKPLTQDDTVKYALIKIENMPKDPNSLEELGIAFQGQFN